MAKRLGNYTIQLENEIQIKGYAAVVGKKEAEGPLGDFFDIAYSDEFCGEKTFEKAETYMQKSAIKTAIRKAGLQKLHIDCALAGDLLNQCIGSSFGMRDLRLPFCGLYGACSTMALSMALSGLLIDSGGIQNTVAAASSHFCSAERQYRYPLEYGGQRTPAAQWTVTGAGACVIGKKDESVSHAVNQDIGISTHNAHPTANGDNMSKLQKGYEVAFKHKIISDTKQQTPTKTICIDKVIIGSVRDLKIKDSNNMGAAMAPAAAQTISRFLADTNSIPTDYDMILTGDLGSTGSALLIELLKEECNMDISPVHKDCGVMIFDPQSQDVHSGGAGCGCSAAVICSYIFKKMQVGELKKVLFVGTGALLSPTSSLQKESIPGIAHGVLLHVYD